MNWKRINGVFKAEKKEKYVVIGCFYPNKDVTAKRVSNIGIAAFYLLDDVSLYPLSLHLPDTVVLCPGDTALLDAGLNPFFDTVQHTWSNGENTPAISVGAAGRYNVAISFNDLVLRDTVTVLMLPGETTLTADTAICEGSTLLLDAGPGFDAYFWQDGSVEQTYEVGAAGFYEVEVENRCGTFADGTKVETEKCTCSVYVPSAFSPNNDGINDTFLPYFDCGLAEPEGLRFLVFDRWGSAMFDSTEQGSGWDGLRRGEPAPPGVYGWRMSYRYQHPERGMVQEEMTGEINLLR